MATHFKDLYRRYMEKGLPSSDLREFKKELDHIPDEELWNTMINMEKDSAPEIGMPFSTFLAFPCTFVQNVFDRMKGRRGERKKKTRYAEAHREIILSRI